MTFDIFKTNKPRWKNLVAVRLKKQEHRNKICKKKNTKKLKTVKLCFRPIVFAVKPIEAR